MKTKIFLTVILISIVTCVYSQTDPIISTDTLSDGSVFITVKDAQNRIWDKYKIQAFDNYELHETIIPSSKEIDNKNAIVSLLNTPYEDGGCLPEDIVYNSNNGQYYLYGGKRLVEYDPVSNTISNTYDVSTSGNLMCTYTWSYMHSNSMAYNNIENKVYTLTNNCDLIVLDCSTGTPTVTETYASTSSIPMMRAIEFNAYTNKVFWIETDFAVRSTIHVLNENTNQHQEIYTSADPIYDIKTNRLGTQLYISNCSKFVVIDLLTNSVVYEYNMFGIEDHANVIIVNSESNRVYVDKLNSTHIKEFDVSPNNIHYIGNISTQIENILEAEFNYSCNRIFYTGYKIGLNEFPEHYYGVINTYYSNEIICQPLNYATGLAINENTGMVYFGGSWIIAMDINNNSNIQTIHNGWRLANKFACNESKGETATISHRDGIVTLISSQNTLEKYATLGFSTNKGVYNPKTNKTLFLASYQNPDGNTASVLRLNSTIISIDGETGLTESFEVCPLAREICIDDENGNIIITQSVENKVFIYDGVTLNQLVEMSFPFSVGYINMFTKSNKIIVSGFNQTAIVDCDTYNTVATITHTGWGRAIVETDENTFYMTAYFDDMGEIIKINPDYSTTQIQQFKPNKIVKNEKYNCLFVTSGIDNLRKIDLTNFQISQSYFLPSDNPRKLIGSVDNEKLYLISEGTHLKVLNISEGTFKTISTGICAHNSILNPYNNQLYLYSQFEWSDLRQHLIILDCNKDIIIDDLCTNQYLEKKYNMVHIQIHHQGAVLNPVNNKIYFANLGYSNITEVDCDPEERTFTPGYTWLSFPRLERTDNNSVPIDPVILNSNNSIPYYFKVSYLYDSRIYNGSQSNGDLTTLQSTCGYKIENQTLTTGHIYVNGTILEPETEITLTDQHENWIGYFLTKPLPIDEAFGDVFDKISVLKTQNWTLVRPDVNDPPIETTGIQGGVLEYGDMVVVEMFEPATLVWNSQGTTIPIPILAVPQEFSYTEEADYTPVAVILDPQDNPDEVAVYSQNICQGASVVYGDTVMVKAYFDNITKGNDTIEIIRYYGQSKSITATSNYVVMNNRTGIMEPRIARARDQESYYIISLEKQAAGLTEDAGMNFEFYPNPSHGEIHIEGFAPEGSTITCIISRPDGTICREIINNKVSSSSFRNTIVADVDPGLYLITLSDGNHRLTKKVVIM